MRRIPLIVLLAVLMGGSQAREAMPEQTLLLARAVTLPDRQVVARVIRIEFPAGFRTPEHIHKGPGPRYVLEGQIRIRDREGTRIYRQGEVFWETGEPMVAENSAEGSTVVLIFEMTPTEPRRKRSGKIVIRPH